MSNMYIYIYICVCVCVCIYMCIHTYRTWGKSNMDIIMYHVQKDQTKHITTEMICTMKHWVGPIDIYWACQVSPPLPLMHPTWARDRWGGASQNGVSKNHPGWIKWGSINLGFPWSIMGCIWILAMLSCLCLSKNGIQPSSPGSVTTWMMDWQYWILNIAE